MSSTDNLPRPADSPCLKCASAGCTSITVGKGGDRKTFPKDFQGQPFKCFIYCTKGQNAGFRLEPDGGLMRLDAARLVMVSALVPILRQTAELAGFEIIGRIPLRDKATGKEYS